MYSYQSRPQKVNYVNPHTLDSHYPKVVIQAYKPTKLDLIKKGVVISGIATLAGFMAGTILGTLAGMVVSLSAVWVLWKCIEIE
jgi:hypothetical protein